MLRGSGFPDSKLTTINSDCLVTPENLATTATRIPALDRPLVKLSIAALDLRPPFFHCEKGKSGLAPALQRFYQRLPPRPPPPPRLSRPPPPPPNSRGLASFTLRLRPLRSLPSNSEIALVASPELSISTKPKPLDWPENLSDTTAALATFPTCEKSASRSSFVTE